MGGYIEKVLAGLTVMAISGIVGCYWGESRVRKRLVPAESPAIVAITGQLERILTRPDRIPTSALQDARAIVAIRNDSRSSLTTLGSFLNSDIDALGKQLADYQRLEATYGIEEWS